MKNSLRMAKTAEIDNWDELLARNPDGGEPLQSSALALGKKSQGWTTEFWVYETSFGKVYATVLTRKVRPLGKICYIPRGPGVINGKQLAEIVKLNRQMSDSVFLIKMEPSVQKGEKIPRELVKTANIQPIVNSAIVDISRNEDDILASFRQNARREIRAAIKDGITIKSRPANRQTAAQFFDLYEITSNRAGFFTHDRDYHAQIWQNYGEIGRGQFFFAYTAEGELIAGAFVCWIGKNAMYKDGGSKRTNAKHFSHLLQWEAMRAMKRRGMTRYDLTNVPPRAELHDPTHRLAGLATFKLSLTNNIVEYIGAYDQVLNAKKYFLWSKFWQRVQQIYAARVKKSTFY